MKSKMICMISLTSVLIMVGGFIKLPVSLVPITLQTLFVVLGGLLLKRYVVYSVLLYILIGLLGVPVFSGGGGIGYVLMPSFGYLLGFIVGGWLIGHYRSEQTRELVSLSLLGLLLIYVFGITYFVLIEYVYYGQLFTMNYLFYNLFLVYLPGDLLSIYVAIKIFKRLKDVSIFRNML